MASSSSMLLSLPHDLIKEILYRTPVESLVRSMVTCKKLNALIKEERFIYKHLDRSPVKFLTTDETVQIMDPVTRTCSQTQVPDEFQPPYYDLFHCDGLMLCRCSAIILISSEFDKLVLWNPLTRKVSWVDEPSQVNYNYFGIGYVVNKNESRRDYKILTFLARPNVEVEAHIYECMSKSWRALLDDTKVDWEAHPRCHGVSVKGNMYWLAKKELSNKNCIIGFDFSDESFKEICFCHLPYDNNYLGCYDGDKLSLLEQNQEALSPIEVWVSSKLADGNVSFIQYLKVDNPNLPALRFFPYRPHPVYCIVKDKLIIACYEREVHEGPDLSTSITLCEIDKGTGVIINQPVTVPPFWNYHVDDTFRPYGHVYVPSLVSPPA